MDAELHRDLITRLLASRTAEARAWLSGGSVSFFRNLGELGTVEESIALVERLYSLGAQTVLAVEIDRYDGDENTGKLLVELPRERFPRSELFAFEKELAEARGFRGTEDRGQLYLFLKLD